MSCVLYILECPCYKLYVGKTKCSLVSTCPSFRPWIMRLWLLRGWRGEEKLNFANLYRILNFMHDFCGWLSVQYIYGRSVMPAYTMKMCLYMGKVYLNAERGWTLAKGQPDFFVICFAFSGFFRLSWNIPLPCWSLATDYVHWKLLELCNLRRLLIHRSRIICHNSSGGYWYNHMVSD